MRLSSVLFLLLNLAGSVPGYGQWVQSGGPYGGVILALAASAEGPGGTNIIAGTAGRGLFLSSDDGATWKPIPSQLEYVTAVQSCGEDLVAADPNKGVFLSRDRGVTWASINSDIGDASVFSLGVSGTDLYAGTGSGTYRSTDGGSTWLPIGSLLSARRVNCVARLGNTILAGTDFGMFVSTDGGTEWAQANAGLWDARVSGMAVDGSVIFAATSGGVFRSGDAGANWEPTNNGLTNPLVTCIHTIKEASGASVVFAGTYYGGVYRSTNAGADWVEMNSGLRRKNVHSLLVTGTGLLAGAEGGLYRLSNGGETWEPAGSGLAALPVRSLLAAPEGMNGMAIFAACEADGGVFRSIDNGMTWEEADNGLEDLLVLSLAAQGSTVFAGTFSMGIYRSSDLGFTWTRTTPTDFGSLVAGLLTDGTDLYAGTAAGVYRSTDGGSDWIRPGAGITDGQVSSLAVCDGIIFAGTHGGGVYRSSNRGETWSKANAGLTSLLISALLSQGEILFAGTIDAGIFRSEDRGQNWTPVSDGLTDSGIRMICAQGPNLFAGTADGLFLSTNGGMKWMSVADGLEKRAVLALLPAGTHMLAGTYAGSVWRRPLAEILPSSHPNLVENPGFDSNREPWKFYTNSEGAFSLASIGGNPAARLDIAGPGTNVQLFQAGISLKAGARYRLRFKAWSSTGHDLHVFLHKHDAPYTSYGLDGWRCDLKTEGKTFVTEFDAENIKERVDDGRLRFWLVSEAGAGDRYFFDDVELQEVDKGPADQPNLVFNGGFESAAARWDFFTDGAGSFETGLMAEGGSEHAAHVTIATPGPNTQLYQSGIKLRAGVTYTLRFRAYSPENRPLGIYVHKHGAPYTSYGLSIQEVALENSWRSYSMNFTASGFKGTAADARIRFWFAGLAQPGDEYYLDDVSLTRYDGQQLQKSQTLAVAGHERAPGEYRLMQNYPNPFNPTTVISSQLPVASHVKLAVYDLLGREVAVLFDGWRAAGCYQDIFSAKGGSASGGDASALASGVYLYRLTAGAFVETRKLIVAK